MAEREYLNEMAEAIRAAIGDGDVVAAVVAEKLHARLVESDPDLLDGWLRASAVQFLTEAIGARDRSARTVSRRRSEARRFASAAESGDEAELSTFAVRLVIDEDNTRRPIGHMTGSDHLFVADGYARSAKTSLMLEAFHRAVAKKVGKKRTADVFSESQYDQMYRSIVRPEPEAKAS
jgi:hypothetical protein